MDAPFRVTTTVDFGADGKQFGVVNVPDSSNESAWGAVRLPIVVIKDGAGPTLLLTGGNHGDEYEGPIALMKLTRRLEPAAVAGRLILMPALNMPAVLAATRVSPIDRRNLNRTFPGRWDGTVTEMIADYVTRAILPIADVVVDLHSGGKTLDFVPFCGMHRLADPEQTARARAAMLAFAAPVSLIIEELDTGGMMDTEVERLGKPFLFTELGGGGTARAATVAVAERGIDDLLRHLGIAEGEPTVRASRLMHVPDVAHYAIAEDRGMLEPLVDLGGEVGAGQPIAQVHDFEKPVRPPVVYRAGRAGTLIGRHAPGLTTPGDCLAVIATDLEAERITADRPAGGP